MIFKEKKRVLKDGTLAAFKTPEIQDAEKLLKYMKIVSEETNFLTRPAEDWENVAVENEEKWVSNNRNSDNVLLIACYVDDEIAGNCNITFSNDSKSSHRATVGIAICKKYWSLGIGSIMFEEILKVANDRDVEIVGLTVVEENERGIALYKKFGFETVGVIPKAYKLKDNTYQNLVHMQKYL
jgi:RimJ/RimL family protein N-acetyltransferase